METDIVDIQSIYKAYNPDEIDHLFSQMLVNSWSYSKVSTFARNEKAFEMSSIYGVYGKKSVSSVAGNAYHEGLRYFFQQYQEGTILGQVDLETVAFEYIGNVAGNQWKINKTNPSVEECIASASESAAKLLANFLSEQSTYTNEIAEILFVEMRLTEWVIINGVDIPMPCNGVIDLAIRTKDGKNVVIDHKSKSKYTPDDEIALSTGIQAITYVKLFEERTKLKLDEVWFVENKESKNKDKSAQMQLFKIQMDNNARRLYEALLYEPLKRMIEAVKNPDYVYLINDSDNFIDKAELYDFWARTMMNEIGVEDFNVEESKKELVAKRLKKIRDSSIQYVSPSVIRKFREDAAAFIPYDLSSTNMTQAERIEHKLISFGISVKVAHEFKGYASNTFLLEVGAGVKITSINSHRLDIASALDVENVRLSKELAMYEGKSYLAVDFSKKREGDLFFDPSILVDRKIPVGKDNFGKVIHWDLDNQSTPHALVCGSTGSGKSVCIISMLEYAILAKVDEIHILDPKREFTKYHDGNKIFVYNDIEDIEEIMGNLVLEMNESIKSGRPRNTLVIFDEFADALDNSRKGSQLDVKTEVQDGNYAPKKGPFGIMMPGAPKYKLKVTSTLKSLEENLKMMLQKSRSAGYRFLVATQRADTKVISGNIKVNLPVQICFKVNKAVDSMVVLDEPGAESLAGRGDGLIKSAEYPEIKRFQAFYKP